MKADETRGRTGNLLAAGVTSPDECLSRPGNSERG